MKSVTDKAQREPDAPRAEREGFEFAVPGPDGTPALFLNMELTRHRQGDGERVRVHARLHASLGRLIPKAVGTHTAVSDREDSTVVGGPLRPYASRGLRRVLRGRLGRLLSPLRYDLDSWMEIEASSALLESGAAALLPVGDALRKIGAKLIPVMETPTLRVWMAPQAPDGRSAQFTLLRVDRAQLPARLARLLASSGFQLAAAVGTVIEPTANTRNRETRPLRASEGAKAIRTAGSPAAHRRTFKP